MPPAPAKAQAMSISQLCQQNDSEEDLTQHHCHTIKQELDEDPLDLNEDDHHRSNGDHTNAGHSSDEFEEFDDSPSRSRSSRPDPAAEQLAAEVLGDMANVSRSSSSSSSSAFATPATPFISRMSSFPLVNSALKAYESGKQNSKVMKVSFLLF